MGIKADFSKIYKEIERKKKEVRSQLEEIGQRAVERAKETGNYHDVTGRLRASNKYEVTDEGLRIYNDCPYAADVESRGLNVISTAALEAVAEVEKLK